MQIRNSSLLFIMLISFLLIYSCKNNKPDIKRKIIGRWQLIKTYNGQTKVSKTIPPDKAITTFDSTRYTEFWDRSMVSMGHYRIVKDTKLNGEISDRIFFKPEIYAEDSTRFFISVKDSQLIITKDVKDVLSWFYKRLK